MLSTPLSFFPDRRNNSTRLLTYVNLILAYGAQAIMPSSSQNAGVGSDIKHALGDACAN